MSEPTNTTSARGCGRDMSSIDSGVWFCGDGGTPLCPTCQPAAPAEGVLHCGWQTGDGPCRLGRDSLCKYCELQLAHSQCLSELAQLRADLAAKDDYAEVYKALRNWAKSAGFEVPEPKWSVGILDIVDAMRSQHCDERSWSDITATGIEDRARAAEAALAQLREELAAMEQDRDRLRDTNQRLNRRCQEADRAVAEKIATQSGRALANSGWNIQHDRAEALKAERDTERDRADRAEKALSDADDELSGSTGLTPGDQVKIDSAYSIIDAALTPEPEEAEK